MESYLAGRDWRSWWRSIGGRGERVKHLVNSQGPQWKTGGQRPSLRIELTVEREIMVENVTRKHLNAPNHPPSGADDDGMRLNAA